MDSSLLSLLSLYTRLSLLATLQHVLEYDSIEKPETYIVTLVFSLVLGAL